MNDKTEITKRFVIETNIHFFEPVVVGGNRFVWMTHHIVRLADEGVGSTYTPTADKGELYGTTRRQGREFTLYVSYTGDVPDSYLLNDDRATQIIDECNGKVSI